MPFAAINGLDLYYEVAGEGEPLVMIHAGIADHRLWDEQFAHFSTHYRVMRYDMRGFGKTAPIAGEFTPLADLVALLDHLGLQRVSLMGCSMGGSLCMDFALAFPERASALIMVCSAPSGLMLDVEEGEPFAALNVQIEAASESGDIDRANELEAQVWMDGTRPASDPTPPAAREKMLQMNLLALQHQLLGLGKRLPNIAPLAGERLHELKLPVLVIVGQYDEPYSLAAGEAMAAQIAGAQKIVLNTNHLPSIEQPERFNEIVSAFLTALPR